MSDKDEIAVERSTQRKQKLQEMYMILAETGGKITALIPIEEDLEKDGRSKVYAKIEDGLSRVTVCMASLRDLEYCED